MIYETIFVIYLLVLLVIAIRNRHYGRTKESYMVANRNLSWWEVACSSLAATLEPMGLIVLFAVVVMFGQAGIGLFVAFIVATILMALISGRVYDVVNTENALTLSDIIKKRIGPYAEKTYLLVSILFVLGTVVSLYSVNLSLFERFLGVDWFLATLISFVVTVGYVVMGGMKVLARTDTAQFFLTLIPALIISFLVFINIGPTVQFNASGAFSGLFWLFAPVILFQNLVKPASWQPILAARSRDDAQKGMWASVLGTMAWVLPVLVVAIFVPALFPGADPNTVLFTAVEAMPVYVGALLFVGMLAALMSSLDTTLFYVSSNIVNNSGLRIFTRNPENKHTYIKWTIAGVSIVTIGLAISVPNFVGLIISMTPLIGITFVPLVFSLWKRVPQLDVAMAVATLCGVGVFAYLFFIPPELFIWNILPVVVTTLVAGVSYWWKA